MCNKKEITILFSIKLSSEKRNWFGFKILFYTENDLLKPKIMKKLSIKYSF